MADRIVDDRSAGPSGSSAGPRDEADSQAIGDGDEAAAREALTGADKAEPPPRVPEIGRQPQAGDPESSEEDDPGEGASAGRDHHEARADLTQQSAASRIAAANARDAVAHARDLAAKARDRAADLRDREHGARGETVANDDRAVTGAEILLRAAKYRSDAAADRAAAAEIRANSAADRDQAAHDREQAARDRLQAALDRDALLQQARDANAASLNDRPASSSGLVDLDHAIDRAHRATGLLVVAHIGVLEGTAAGNSSGGVADADDLGRVVRAIRRHLRRSDLIVRLDSDELLCVMFGATAENASVRFGSVRAELEAEPDPQRICVGLTALAPGDGLYELIKSADAADAARYSDLDLS